MKAADTLCRALEREAARLQKLGYYVRAHELRGKRLDVESANGLLEDSKKMRGKVG